MLPGILLVDPDWVITINKVDVHKYINEWEFIDDEKDQSQIKAVLGNPDMVNSGKFSYGQDMQISFGYLGNLIGPAYLPVAEIKESYPTGKALTVTVTGKDETSKTSGGNNKGNQGKMDDAKRLRQSLQDRGLHMDGNVKGENSGCKGACYNESDRALAYRLGNSLSTEQEGGGGGSQDSPQNPLSNEKSSSSDGTGMQKDQGHTFSSASKWSGDGEGGKRDKNRGKNHGGQQNQDPITAKLELKGYPLLKAKTTVEIQGVGPAASGTYYVKKVTHTWKQGENYKTVAELSRGGTGGKGVGGTPPIVMYADIWKKGSVYVGARKTGDSPQTTFIFGEGKHVVSFEMTVKPQKNRGGGEPKKGGKGEGIDLRKKLAAYTEDGGEDSDKEGSSDGNAPRSSGQ